MELKEYELIKESIQTKGQILLNVYKDFKSNRVICRDMKFYIPDSEVPTHAWVFFLIMKMKHDFIYSEKKLRMYNDEINADSFYVINDAVVFLFFPPVL